MLSSCDGVCLDASTSCVRLVCLQHHQHDVHCRLCVVLGGSCRGKAGDRTWARLSRSSCCLLADWISSIDSSHFKAATGSTHCRTLRAAICATAAAAVIGEGAAVCLMSHHCPAGTDTGGVWLQGTGGAYAVGPCCSGSKGAAAAECMYGCSSFVEGHTGRGAAADVLCTRTCCCICCLLNQLRCVTDKSLCQCILADHTQPAAQHTTRKSYHCYCYMAQGKPEHPCYHTSAAERWCS